jgi:hypothetical protein
VSVAGNSVFSFQTAPNVGDGFIVVVKLRAFLTTGGRQLAYERFIKPARLQNQESGELPLWKVFVDFGGHRVLDVGFAFIRDLSDR